MTGGQQSLVVVRDFDNQHVRCRVRPIPAGTLEAHQRLLAAGP
jgi:4-hydroxybenzoate polyprenyltransferase